MKLKTLLTGLCLSSLVSPALVFASTCDKSTISVTNNTEWELVAQIDPYSGHFRNANNQLSKDETIEYVNPGTHVLGTLESSGGTNGDAHANIRFYRPGKHNVYLKVKLHFNTASSTGSGECRANAEVIELNTWDSPSFDLVNGSNKGEASIHIGDIYKKPLPPLQWDKD